MKNEKCIIFPKSWYANSYPDNGAVCDYSLHCNYLPSFDDFGISADENKFLLEFNISLPIMWDKPLLNRNISSAPLHLFDEVS